MNVRQMLFLGAVLIALINVKARAVYSVAQRYVNFQAAFVEHERGPLKPIQVLVQGVFPNGCYKWRGAVVKQLDDNNYEIKGLAIYRQGICTMQLVSFQSQVNLGVLPAGHHKIWISSRNGDVILREVNL